VLDVWYVENQSLAVNLQILWRTLVAVVSRGGVSEPGIATARTFQPPSGD